MKLSQLSLADYNQLDNIPVINQDLSATDFTPVANTYYRHTGATTDTFTQGVIYLYDTAYHKLGESGGGTTLNKYTYIGGNMTLARKIMHDSKVSYMDLEISNVGCVLPVSRYASLYRANGTVTTENSIVSVTITELSGSLYIRTTTLLNTNNVLSLSSEESLLTYVVIVYFNDTEITA